MYLIQHSMHVHSDVYAYLNQHKMYHFLGVACGTTQLGVQAWRHGWVPALSYPRDLSC